MPPKNFLDALNNKPASPPKSQSENLANAMYGGGTNPAELDSFFDELSRNENTLAHFEVADGGQITVGNFRISKTGLQIADGVEADEWQAFGQHIRTMETSIQWIIGDWLAYGERQYGKTYQEVADLTGYSYGVLQNLVWVAKQFDFSYRYENLSHTHHQIALSLCEGEASKAMQWLERASTEGWSVKRMADEIKGVPPTPPPHDTKIPKFWADMTTFLSKQRKLASRVGDAEREEMIRGLHILIEQIEEIGKSESKKRR